MQLEVRRELFRRHPVDAGAASVPFHALQRLEKVAAFHDRLHREPKPRAVFLMTRRRRFLAATGSRGFTPTSRREPRLRGHLRRFVVENQGRLALLSVPPFVGDGRH